MRFGNEDLWQLADEAGLREDRRVQRAIAVNELMSDRKSAEDLRRWLVVRAVRLNPSGSVFGRAISPEEAWGELGLGSIEDAMGAPFGLRREELPGHILVLGMTGAGKTTTIMRLLKQLILQDRASGGRMAKGLIFDGKRDYAGLKGVFPEIDVFRVPGGNFRWNPLEPAIPDPDCRRWAGILASAFANVMGFIGGQSTENLIHRYLLGLYALYNTDAEIYPCLPDFRDYLLHLKRTKRVERYSEEYQSFMRILNRLESLCNSFERTVECSRGYALSEILSRHVVFDMADLKPDAQAFFSECFLLQAIWHRICMASGVEAPGTSPYLTKRKGSFQSTERKASRAYAT